MISTSGTGGGNADGSDLRTTWFGAALLFAAFFALYQATRQSNLSTYHDAIGHLKAVLTEHGPHPHHLLFRWIERGWLWSAGTLDGSPRAAAESAACLSGIAGASVVALVFLMLRVRFGLSLLAAGLGASFVGFSYGPWLHATVINVYIVPLSLLLACLLLLSGDGARLRTYAAVGALHALAVLIHQAYVLFSLVVVVAAFMTGPDRAQGRRLLLAYGTVFGMLVGVSYALVGALVYHATGPGDFLYWLTSYAHDNYWSAPGLGGAMKAAVGYARSYFGLMFLLAIPSIRGHMTTILGRSVADEEYVVRNLSPTFATILLLVVCVGAALIVTTLVVRAHVVPRIWTRHRRPFVLTLAMFGVFAAFFLFWMPQLLEFWIPQLTAFWILWAAIALHPTQGVRWPVAAGGAICASLLLSNFFGGIRYLGSERDDYYYACAEVTEAHVAPDAVVLVESEYLHDYLNVFFDIRSLRLTADRDEPPPAPVVLAELTGADRALDGAAADGGNVYVAAPRPNVYVAGGEVPPRMLSGSNVHVRAIVEQPCPLWEVVSGR